MRAFRSMPPGPIPPASSSYGTPLKLISTTPYRRVDTNASHGVPDYFSWSPLAPSLQQFRNGIVRREMSSPFSKFIPRSAPAVLLVLTLAAGVAFAAVSHLVNRYNANQQARGRN